MGYFLQRRLTGVTLCVLALPWAWLRPVTIVGPVVLDTQPNDWLEDYTCVVPQPTSNKQKRRTSSNIINL